MLINKFLNIFAEKYRTYTFFGGEGFEYGFRTFRGENDRRKGGFRGFSERFRLRLLYGDGDLEEELVSDLQAF